jgi:hypothetical protein
VAFATSGDYLLLATDEDLMAGALALLSGKSSPTLQDEDWYKSAVSAAAPAGDLRMVVNMPLLVKAPHFRSYWVERNITALKAYSAEVADIHRSPTEIREDRVLLKANSPADTGPPTTANAAIAELLGRVPAQGGIYRAWGAPEADMVLDLLEQKLLAPHPGQGVPSQISPGVALTEGQTGSESDLETRIDVPPLQGTAGAPGTDALKKLLHAAPLQGALEYQRLQNIGRSPFIEPHSAVIIRRSTDWDSEAARTALRAAIEDLWTTSRIGAKWVENRQGDADCYQLDGLVPLAVATKGRILIVADSAETLRPLLAPSPMAEAGQNVIYAAGFRHSAERGNIVKMIRLVEMPPAQQDRGTPDQSGREPLFFSENLASLSRSLESIESESLVVEDRGSELRETVTYRLKK